MQNPEKLLPDLRYAFARSGGAGGQNVNKVATKAELRFDVANTTLLTDDERATLLEKWANRLTTEGELVLTHQTERTQLGNKEKVTKKFFRLLQQAFVQPKPRRATSPSATARAERRTDKLKQSQKKENRRKPEV